MNTPPKGGLGAPGDKTPSAQVVEPPHETDIGDIEASTKFMAVLDEQSRSPNIASEELVNAKKELDMITLTVKPPFPKQLWLSFRVSTTTQPGETRVACRAKILRDKDQIGTIAFVAGAPDTPNPYVYKADVLQGLDTAPKTLLVYAQGELVLLPKGVDPKTVDPKTATGAENLVGAMRSNPVRINFASGEATP